MRFCDYKRIMKATSLGRVKRSLYIREDIDQFMRHLAIDKNKKFSDILDDCLIACFAKRLEEKKEKRKT
jgi:hypothetical protein